MRSLVGVLLILLLAGCVTPKDEAEQDPLFGLCPQWEQGLGGQTVSLRLDGETKVRERDLGPAEATWNGHALDLLRVAITGLNVTGHLELRAFAADGKQLALRDYRSESGAQIVPVAVLTNSAANHEFDVLLSSIRQGSTPAPTPARLSWTLVGDEALVDYEVTYHYKVCGAILAD